MQRIEDRGSRIEKTMGRMLQVEPQAPVRWSLSIAVLVSMVISLTLIPVFAAKFLAGRPMPPPGPIYRFFAYLYERVLAVALHLPWVTLALSVAAVGAGVVLYTGIPDYRKTQEKGQPP